MNPRYLASHMLQYSGVNALALALRRDSLAVLCYHRVMDASDPEREAADPALVTSTHVFERQMDIIAHRFRPVSLCQALGWLEGSLGLPHRAVLVTFDDGVADTYMNAFPVMKRLGIPGVVFLATGYIGTSRRYWTDLVHEYVAAHSDAQMASQAVERLKRIPSALRQDSVDDLIASAGLAADGRPPNLTWEQVEEMAEHGFEFGSHTRNHLILPHETEDTARRELEDCRADLRARLRHEPAAFAYPDGQFDQRTMRLVSEFGYRSGFTCDEGFARRKSDVLALPRFLVHDGISADSRGNFSAAMFLTYISGVIPRRYRRSAT